MGAGAETGYSGFVVGRSQTLDGLSHRIAPLAGLLLLALLIGAPTAARGQTCTFDFGSGIGPVAYDPSNTTPSDSCVTFTFDCTNAKRATVTLSTGNSGTYALRTMSNGSSLLGYNLYTDATYASVFGDGISAGTVTASARRGEPVQVCLRITAEQWVEAGAYGDTITMTLNF